MESIQNENYLKRKNHLSFGVETQCGAGQNRSVVPSFMPSREEVSTILFLNVLTSILSASLCSFMLMDSRSDQGKELLLEMAVVCAAIFCG